MVVTEWQVDLDAGPDVGPDAAVSPHPSFEVAVADRDARTPGHRLRIDESLVPRVSGWTTEWDPSDEGPIEP